MFNGQGGEYTAVLLDENPKATHLGILSHTDISRESSLSTILMQGISRSEHMDATVQKATELGINEIIPVICERSVSMNKARIDRKIERWRQISISACEQCGRNSLPVVHAATSLDKAIGLAADSTRLVLDPTANRGITTIKSHQDSVCILCGPEGGLSPAELDVAVAAGYTRVSFGQRVLRTETAGPAFISALQVMWGDMG